MADVNAKWVSVSDFKGVLIQGKTFRIKSDQIQFVVKAGRNV